MERGKNPDIINGRMPVAVVHLARFGGNKNGATKDLAKMFGTTVGKIDDIKKNRNFAYVEEKTKFTEGQITEGVEWLKKHPRYDADGVDKLVQELDAYARATDAEAAEFEKIRSEARGQQTTTKEGQPADGGGGNRRGRKPKAEKKEDEAKSAEGEAAQEASTEPSAEALID